MFRIQHRPDRLISPCIFLLLTAFFTMHLAACGGTPITSQDHDDTQPSDSTVALSTSGDSEEHDEHGEPGEPSVVELSPEAAAQIDIRTAPASQRMLAPELQTTGQVDFDQNRLAHVSPRVTGRVHRVDARLGQQVRAGQKLAEVDSIELGQAKAVYLRAQALEELARKTFDRIQGLLADGIASEQKVLEAETDLRETAASLHIAKETLRLYGLTSKQITSLTFDGRANSIYPLRAPFAGTIVERHATLGELVTPERNLFTLADVSQLWIWIDIYPRDLGGVHLGDRAQARVDAFPGDTFEGTVSYLSASVDSDTRTVRARIDVANLDGKLRPGMFVEVQLVDPHADAGGKELVQTLAVAQTAVLRDGDEWIVFVPLGEHRYERREVRTGRQAGDYVEILEGIESGESVVVEGAFLLKSAAAKDSLGGGHSH